MSAEQVAVAATALTPERLAAAAEQGVALGEVDAVLTGLAVEQPHADFVAAVRHYLARLDPDGPEPDPTEGRRLSLAKHADGSLSFRGELDAVGGEKLQAALESYVQADRPSGDERSRAQRLGDALVQLCDTTLAAGGLPTLRTVKPHVAVVIDLDDLAGTATGPEAARMGFGAVISAARARWLACDSTVSRVVFGPDGAPLDLGREQRLANRCGPSAGAHRELASGGGRRGPFSGALARRQRDQPRQQRPALRAAPHQGAPRLPRRATTGWPVAHLAPRRHRDHRPDTAGSRSACSSGLIGPPTSADGPLEGVLAVRGASRHGRPATARPSRPPRGRARCAGWRARSRPAPAAGRRPGPG
ncbi:protein of unknown function [Geodermatophilus telluris]|uniref:DUF222 domain-containing protein n=1 Tax=Geodermatophilus telluris TaxID=1190417 RepID=A0A1G6MIZ9_9ACTN|nr:protein of unknown function [Geodermatophilus telluris]